MQSANLDVEVAMLRVAHLSADALYEMAGWLALSQDQRADRHWHRDLDAERMGFDKKPRAEQLRIAAAALLLASDELDKTPFDRWLESTFTEKAIRNLSEGVINSMRAAFEAGRNG